MKNKNMKNLNFYFKEVLFLTLRIKDSYLYLAKIYNFEENKKEEQKNIRYCAFIRSKK